MRTLHHPQIEDITVEGILHAFADPVRLQIFLDLACAETSKNCSSYLNVTSSPLPKSTLSQHFKVLREAGLVYSERRGVELHNRSRCPELEERFGAMIQAIVSAFVQQQKEKASSGN